MKTKFSTIILIGTLLSLNSFARETGDKEGNGGGSIVCTNTNGTIISAKLLDLREAEKKQLTITRSNLPREEQLEKALLKLSLTAPDLVAKMRVILGPNSQALDSKVVPLEIGKRLAPPSDMDLKLLDEPRNCSPEGVANYNDFTETLTEDLVIYKAMSPTDQAALMFHEALYKVWRGGSTSVVDSTRARKLTGAVFAVEPLVTIPPSAGIASATHLCENQDSSFYVIPLANGEIRLQFTKIDHQNMMELTTFDQTQDGSLLLNALASKDLVTTMEDTSEIVKKLDIETSSYFQPSYHVILTDLIQFLDESDLNKGEHMMRETLHMGTEACSDELPNDSKLSCKKL